MVAGPDPLLTMARGDCGGATLAGPFDVIRGDLTQLQIDVGHVDLGSVACVGGGLDWDRVTDYLLEPIARVSILIPAEFIGVMMQIANDHRQVGTEQRGGYPGTDRGEVGDDIEHA